MTPQFTVLGYLGASMVTMEGIRPDVHSVLYDAETSRLWKVTKVILQDDNTWGVQLQGGTPGGLWSGSWVPNGKLTPLPAEGAVLTCPHQSNDQTQP